MAKTVKSSVNIRSKTGYSVLVIGAAGFVRTHISAALKRLRFRPAIVWASSSSVRKRPNRSTPPASLYAATKKAGEEISHKYNHIFGLSLTGLSFFMVYGSWGRPDMAHFFFTKDILKGKPVPIFESSNHGIVARDFTYIDDIVKGCLGALDTAEKSTGSGGKKKGAAQFRIFNLGNTMPVPVSDLASILEKLKVKAKW
ncbi:putative UDP-glucuronate 4-epimerase [Helianthus anomalus]